jgi:hypothetical protein
MCYGIYDKKTHLLEWSIGVGNQVVAIELSGIRRVAIMLMRV